MIKGKHIFVFVLFMILVCMLFSGCGSEWMGEVPRDMVLYQSTQPSMPESIASGFVEEDSIESGQSISAHCFLMEEAGSYAYDTLSAAEKIWYRDIERILGGFGEKMRLSSEGLLAGLEAKDIDKIFQCVLSDHPELFYVEGYAYTKFSVGGEVTSIELSGTYNVDLETAIVRQQEIETAVTELLQGIQADVGEYEKVKYVYDRVIISTDYLLDAPDNQNIYSVFTRHYSVCQGYAKAVQYLLNKLGVECALVLGNVEGGEGHAWNLVKIDGEYYYLDATWGDASYRMADGSESNHAGRDTISYDYLNVTTEEILRTHTLGDLYSLPQCTAREANYYVREGNFIAMYDEEEIAEIFSAASEMEQDSVTIKCVDEPCYREVYTALIEKQEIFKYLQGNGTKVAFSQNEKQLSLTFWVTNE